MALFGRKKSTIGLDVGSGLIKVAVIDHSRGEPELARVVITPLLADAIVEGEVMDPGIVTDAIRMALEQSGLKSRDVVTAKPDALVALAMNVVVQLRPSLDSLRFRFWPWPSAASRRPKTVTLFTLMVEPRSIWRKFPTAWPPPAVLAMAQ